MRSSESYQVQVLRLDGWTTVHRVRHIGMAEKMARAETINWVFVRVMDSRGHVILMMESQPKPDNPAAAAAELPSAEPVVQSSAEHRGRKSGRGRGRADAQPASEELVDLEFVRPDLEGR